MQAFVKVNNFGIMINAGLNPKNWLIKAYGIKDLFEILIVVSMTVTNHVILVIISTMKVVSAKLINWLKNVLKILMK